MRLQTQATLRMASIWIGLAFAAFLAWELGPAILMAFGAILLAMVFDLLTRAVCRLFHLPRGWSFAISAAAIIAVMIILCLWLFGMNLVQQFGQVMHRISAGEASFKAMLQHMGLGTSSLLDGGNSLVSGMLGKVVSTQTDRSTPMWHPGSTEDNFVRIHQTLRVTPAMAAGVTDRLWD